MKKLILIFSSIILSYESIPYTDIFTLDNGMKVVVSPNYETPLVNVSFLIDHGTLDDPYGTRGYGHHIAKLLMGKPELEPNSIVKHDQYNEDFENMGVIFDPLTNEHNFNSSQSLWHTFFEEQFLYEDIEPALMLAHKIFTKTKFKKDAPMFWQKLVNRDLGGSFQLVVTNESSGESTATELTKRFQRLDYSGDELLKVHALNMYYGLSINGEYASGDDDENMWKFNKHKKAKNWFFDKYSPNNTTLMISGNINPQYVKKLVARIFSDWQPSNEIQSEKSNISTIIKQDSSQYRYVYCEKDTRIGLIGDAPSYNDPDYYAHWIITHSLALRNNNMLEWLPSANLETIYNPEAPISILSFTKDTESTLEELNTSYQKLYNTLQELSSGDISETELEIWKKEVNQAYLILYNNPIKYSKLILKYLNSGFDLDAIETELEKLNTVTLDDYNRVANKYFNPDNFKVIITANKEPREFTNQFNGMSYVDEFGTSIERDSIPEKKDGIIDGCDLPENTVYLTDSGEVFYNSSSAIASFSFKVDGAINYKGLEGEEETIIKPLVDDSGNSHAVKAGFEFSVNKKISFL